MSITSTLVTDDWRYIDIGDFGDATEDLIKKGLSGTATFTPVGLTGVSVDDTPEDWYVVARPRTARYTLGRLVGGDGVKGIRLVSSVDGNPVVWRVERALRWNGQLVPGIDPVTVIFSGEANHLPEMSPLAADSDTSITDAVVAVGQLIAAAQEAATRAEAEGALAAAANGAAQQAKADTVIARSDAQEAARLAQEGAARVGTAQEVLDARDEAGQSAAHAAESRQSSEDAAVRAEIARDAAESKVVEKITELKGTAPAAFDTIEELAAWVVGNQDAVAGLIRQIAGKVTTTTGTSQVYATDVSGAQSTLSWQAGTAGADSVAVRGAGGRLLVGTPTSAGHAVTKDYADTAVSGVETMASDAASVAAAAQSTANAALPADRIQVVTTLPTTLVTGVVYYVTGAN